VDRRIVKRPAWRVRAARPHAAERAIPRVEAKNRLPTFSHCAWYERQPLPIVVTRSTHRPQLRADTVSSPSLLPSARCLDSLLSRLLDQLRAVHALPITRAQLEETQIFRGAPQFAEGVVAHERYGQGSDPSTQWPMTGHPSIGIIDWPRYVPGPIENVVRVGIPG